MIMRKYKCLYFVFNIYLNICIYFLLAFSSFYVFFFLFYLFILFL